MPGPYLTKTIKMTRQTIERFSHLYETEGKLNEALEYLKNILTNSRYLYRYHTLQALKKKYPELDL